jgi:hypothetical protein
MAVHPVDTVTGLAHAAAHPIDTVKAVAADIAAKSDTLEGQGELVGDVLLTIATGGSAGAASKTAQVAKIVDRVDRAAEEAAKASRLAEKAAADAEKGGEKAGGGTSAADPEASGSTPNTSPAPTVDLHRPYIRKSVRDEVEARAPKDEHGNFVDPNTGESIIGKYDLGHVKDHEFRTEKANAEKEGLTQKQFNDRMNNPDLYQIEDPASNRSHKYEAKDPKPNTNDNNGQ